MVLWDVEQTDTTFSQYCQLTIAYSAEKLLALLSQGMRDCQTY